VDGLFEYAGRDRRAPRSRVNVVGSVTAQAVGAAQGQALRSVLATLSTPGSADPVEIKKAGRRRWAGRRNRMNRSSCRLVHLAIRASWRTGVSSLHPHDLLNVVLQSVCSRVATLGMAPSLDRGYSMS
jgi:hypothetical protein